MAKNSITDYSKTAASNTDIQSVDIAEGCLPSGINNAIREIMADLADMNDGTVSLTSPAFTSVDINGGTIDGAVIGGASAAAGTFTTGQFNTSLNVDGTVTADGLTVDGVVNVDGNIGLDTNHVFGQGLGYGGNTTSAGAGTLTLYNASTGAVVIDGFAPAYLADSGVILKQSGVKGFHLKNNNDIEFYEDTGTTAKLFWDASAESLGIGTSSPSTPLEISSSTPYLTLNYSGGSGTSSRATIIGKNNDGTTWSVGGVTGSGHFGLVNAKNADMFFSTNNTERMRITSSGNVFIGNKTGLSDGGAGHAFAGSAAHGLFYHTRDSGLVGSIKRETNYGDVLRFVGATGHLGHIGGDISNRLYINTENTTGYLYVDGSPKFRWRTNDFIPHDNGTKNLGTWNTRWKDLYLGGGVYLGGTGAANKLDDYEEGNWTPTTASDSTGVLNAASVGHYVKVGQLVMVQCQFKVDTTFANVAIGGLPFLPYIRSGLSNVFGGHPVATNTGTVFATVTDSDQRVRFYTSLVNAGHTPRTTNSVYRFNFVYETLS